MKEDLTNTEFDPVTGYPVSETTYTDFGIRKTTNEYDIATGRKTKKIISYDGRISTWKEYEYETDSGRLKKKTRHKADGTIMSWVIYDYDSKTEMLKKKTYFNSDGTVSCWTTYRYHPIFGDMLYRKTRYRNNGRKLEETVYGDEETVIKETEYEEDGSKTSRFYNWDYGMLEEEITYNPNRTIVSKCIYSYDFFSGELESSVTHNRESNVWTYTEYDRGTGYPTHLTTYLDRKLTRIAWECECDPETEGLLLSETSYRPDGSVFSYTEYLHVPVGEKMHVEADFYSSGKESETNEYDPVTGKLTVKREYYHNGTMLSRTEYDPRTGEKAKFTMFSRGIHYFTKSTTYYNGRMPGQGEILEFCSGQGD